MLQRVVFTRKTAAALEREIRAFNPWPVSYLQLGTQQLKIWQARVESGSATPGQVVRVDKKGIAIGTAEGVLVIEQLQPPGKKSHGCGGFPQWTRRLV